MATGGDAQFFFVPLRLIVGDQKNDGLAFLHVAEETQCGADVRAVAGFLGCEDLTHQAHDRGAPFARRDGFDDAVAEQDQTDLVLVAQRGKREQTGDFGGQFGFGTRAGTEHLRSRDVDQEHDRQLALLREALDVRVSGAGRDIPVNGADVVAGDIGAHLIEFDAVPLEYRVVITGETIIDQPVGQEFDPADLLHQFLCVDGHGEGWEVGGVRR